VITEMDSIWMLLRILALTALQLLILENLPQSLDANVQTLTGTGSHQLKVVSHVISQPTYYSVQEFVFLVI